MKQILKYGLGCLFMTAVVSTFLSCDDNDEVSPLSKAIYPKSVEMIISEDLQQLIYVDDMKVKVLPLVKGEKIELGYNITPDDVTYKEVNWTSSNANVATVDANGTVNAISGDGTGVAVIQVAPSVYYSGSDVASALKVLVVNSLISAESITITSSADNVYAGETVQLTAGILPSDATYKTVKWSSSDETVATVDKNGVVTGLDSGKGAAVPVTITATSLDGANVIATKEIIVNSIVQPEEVAIDQNYSSTNGYEFAIAEKSVALNFTTVPENCTKSLIEWTSSDETIATVKAGVVTFNANGVFGKVTITATCPETGNSSSIELNLAEGLIRELFRNENYTWANASNAESHTWNKDGGYITINTKLTGGKCRGDLICKSTTSWLHSGNYPIFAVRMDDVKDYEGVTARNITLDASGMCDGTKYSGGLDGNNNKWLNDYKCSDGSHVLIYDMASQKWGTGGLLPATAVASFTTLQFKYADIVSSTAVSYNVYWVQTFKTLQDVQAYIKSEGLTYEVIK